MFYDKKIKYLDYLENGDKIRNAGFVKIEVMDEDCNIQINVSGLYPTDTLQRDVWIGNGEKETVIGSLSLESGRGTLQLKNLSVNGLGKDGIPYKEMYEIRIPLAKTREVYCRVGEKMPQLSKVWSQKEQVISSPSRTENATAGNKEIGISNVLVTFEGKVEKLPEMLKVPDVIEDQQPEGSHAIEENLPETSIGTEKQAPNIIDMQRRVQSETAAAGIEEQYIFIAADSMVEQLPKPVDAMLEQISESADAVSEQILSSVDAMSEQVSDSVDAMSEQVSDSVDAVSEQISDSVDAMSEQISDSVDAMSEQILSPVDTMPEQILSSVDTMPEQISESADTMSVQISRSVDTMSEQFPEVSGTMSEVINRKESQMGRTAPIVTGQNGNASTQNKKTNPPSAKLYEDKWRQLMYLYPHIAPFQDEREYLSIGPNDFVIFHRDYHKLVNNSFLLHGYFNYDHLVLARIEKRGEERFFIGVPGNFYEREKQVAIMFGFESFECRHEPAREGDFGYYMIRVEI